LVLARMRHDGFGGLVVEAEVLTGIGVGSQPVR
jgi:hypothetical protein